MHSDSLNESSLVAGVDEVGRGPLFGPVVAAAVILDPAHPIDGLDDSKRLSEARREVLYAQICEFALAWSVAEASVEEIDDINILHATMLAMKRAVAGLALQPVHVQVDGNRCPDVDVSCEAIVKGDGKITCISAASIIAKVTRDRQLVELDKVYPGYGLASHKGYGTKQHLLAIDELGVTPLHRRSFAQVRRVLEQ